MSQTIAAIATRALSDDFDAGLQAKAEQFVREAILEIYSNTRLARGDQALTLANISAAATTLSAVTVEGSYFEAMIFADNGDELQPADLPDLLQLRASSPGRTGRPLVYAGHGDFTTEAPVLEIWPAADRAYQVFTTGARAPAAADLDSGDTAPLPDTWLKLPYYYARSELFALESDTEMESLWSTKWINGCTAMRSDVQRRSKMVRQIPGTWAGMRSTMPAFHRPGLF